MAETHPGWRFKGRGAVGNPTGRFEHQTTLPIDDGWGSLEQDAPEVRETCLHPDASRGIITTNDSPDIPFSRSINPYQGCEHGCVYCYARPSHAYYNLSPGLDFETQIFFKPDGPALLEAALRKRGYVPEVIMLGANTDPYQPAERRLELTRGILRVLSDFQHPVAIITKSAGVVRDLDILASMAERRLVRVMISVTSLKPQLARTMEPRASSPGRRLEAIRALSEAGIPTGVMTAPMILGLNDAELEAILEAAADAGARAAGYVLLRLPNEVKDVFVSWLETHFPEAAPRVLNLIRSTRRGELNVTEFGERMRGSGAFAELLRKRFDVACRRLSLTGPLEPLDTTRFAPPARAGDQLRLFG